MPQAAQPARGIGGAVEVLAGEEEPGLWQSRCPMLVRGDLDEAAEVVEHGAGAQEVAVVLALLDLVLEGDVIGEVVIQAVAADLALRELCPRNWILCCTLWAGRPELVVEDALDVPLRRQPRFRPCRGRLGPHGCRHRVTDPRRDDRCSAGP